MDIFMIEASRTIDNPLGSNYTEDYIEAEYGFFTSKEKAEEFAKGLNKYVEDAYEQKTGTLRRQEEAQELAFVEQMRQYDYLVAGGFEATRPAAPRTLYIETLESFVARMGVHSYRAVKVEEAKA
jgi:hypothetical protein